MTLADKARACADAAPLHQSAEVLRECADALDAKDAEIDQLRADLAAERRGQGFEELLANVEDEWNSLHDYLQPPCQCPSCKGAQRHDYSRGTPADGHWDVAAQWAHDIRVHVDTLRAELAALQSPDRQVAYTEAQYTAIQEAWAKDAADLAALREAVGVIPMMHSRECMEMGERTTRRCSCNTDAANAALAAAKKMAGGE